MKKTIGVLILPLGLMIGSLAHAQTAPVPNAQTTEFAPPRELPTASPASSDPSGLTTVDSGSSIDKPATVGAMPQTGYHAPVIGKPAEPAPHTRTREPIIAPAVSDTDARPERPRASSKQRRPRKKG